MNGQTDIHLDRWIDSAIIIYFSLWGLKITILLIKMLVNWTYEVLPFVLLFDTLSLSVTSLSVPFLSFMAQNFCAGG